MMSNRCSLKSFFLILPLIFISAGCLTLGDDFKSSTNWIEVDRTSKGSTQKLLGEPYSAGWTSDGETWTYGHYVFRLIGARRYKYKELKFYWNPDGTVKSYSFNSSFPADKSLKP
jgi:hypothetical protein